MKNKLPYMLIALLIIMQIYSVSKISMLESRVAYLDNSILERNNDIHSEISGIYSNVNEMLEQQASIIHFADINIGDFNSNTSTIPIAFIVEPKQVTDSMIVSLKFTDEQVNLEKNDTVYSITKDFPLNTNDIAPTIIIEDNGVQSITEDSNLKISTIVEKIFPFIYAHTDGSISESPSTNAAEFDYERDGIVVIDADFDNFSSVKFITKVDDIVVEERNLSADDMQANHLLIEDEFILKEGQVLTSYIIALDNNDFSHEILTHHHVGGSDIQREPYFEDLKITSSDGSVIYDSMENEN